MFRRPRRAPLFPYTTLFRSLERATLGVQEGLAEPARDAQQLHAVLVADPERHGISDEHRMKLLRIARSEEHTSELQSRVDLVCRLLLEKKKNKQYTTSKPTL